MVDLILIAFSALTFALGAWAGKSYGSVADMIERLRKAFRG